MKKKISIVLTTIAIVIFGVFTYYSSSTEADKKTETIVTDKDGKEVEPINGDRDNIGH